MQIIIFICVERKALFEAKRELYDFSVALTLETSQRTSGFRQ